MTPETEHMIKVLKAAMRVLGYRHQNVEKELGVAQGYLSRLFRGVMDLRFDHVVEIARAIGLKPEELFQITYCPAPKPSSEETLLLIHKLAAEGLLRKPAPEPEAATSEGQSIEEEKERIERIVLRTFEKFFSSMAKSAGSQE